MRAPRPLLALPLLLGALACVTVEEGRASLSPQQLGGHLPRWHELPDDGVVRDKEEPDRLLAHEAQRLEAAGRWSDARRLWNELDARRPDSREALLAQVRTLHAQGFARQAAALLRRAREEHPDDAELALAAGDAWLAAGDVDAALAAYRAAAELLPGERRARHAILAALLLADRPAEVAAELDGLSVAQVPVHLLLHTGRAGLVAARYDLAAPCFALWLAEHPKDQDAWVDLARASVLAGDHASAAAALASARALDPEHPRLALLSGHVAFLAGDQGQALRLYAVAAEAGVDPLGLLMRFWTPAGMGADGAAGARRPAASGAEPPRALPRVAPELDRRPGARPRRREP